MLQAGYASRILQPEITGDLLSSSTSGVSSPLPSSRAAGGGRTVTSSLSTPGRLSEHRSGDATSEGTVSENFFPSSLRSWTAN